MTDLTEREKQIVAWLRGEERLWKDAAYRRTFLEKVSAAVQVFHLSKDRSIPRLKAALFIFSSAPATMATAYGRAADAIERGEHRKDKNDG